MHLNRGFTVTEQAPAQAPAASPDQPQPVYVVQQAPATKKGLGITSMVLGISALVFSWTAIFSFILLLAAFVFGIMSLKRKEQPRGFAITGIVLGSISVVIVIIIAVVASLVAGALFSVSSY